MLADSTLCLGCPPPDPFASSIQEALPLADQPHLLQPNALRGDMFGAPKQPLIATASSGDGAGGITAALSTKLGLANRSTSSTAISASSSESAEPRASAAPSTSRAAAKASADPPSNEPQDLSMASSSSSSKMVSSFTSPKKAFMLRDAANRESERSSAGEG